LAAHAEEALDGGDGVGLDGGVKGEGEGEDAFHESGSGVVRLVEN
jgi:hypothetical protein